MTHPIRALYDNLSAKADRPALFDGATTLTHGELVALVERAAADLIARGIQPGDRIGLCAANSWRHVVAYLAILRANAVWMPLNPRNGAGLNGQFQTRAAPVLTLHDDASAPQMGATAHPLPLEGWLADLPDAAPPEILDAPDAPFALKFTGGSTGVPK
ncbi:MAG: fatty-acid--CoA ligase, partial [Brevundimonas sp.]